MFGHRRVQLVGVLKEVYDEFDEADEESLTAEQAAARFRHGWRKQIGQLLKTLDTLGLVCATEDGTFAG